MASVQLSTPADGVALLLLDNPPHNFITWAMLEEIEAHLATVEQSDARVLVLASDVPGYFSAHAWLEDLIAVFSGGTPSGDGRAWYRLLTALRAGRLVTIAANNGQAGGGGAEIGWACNLRTAAASATYGQPEVALGIIPGAGGTTRLARLVGEGRAMEMVLDGRPIGAAQALDWGAVNRVYPDAQLREATIAWAAEIAQRPPWALAAAKQSLTEGADLPLDAAVRNEGKILASLATRDDAQALMRAAQDRYDAGADPQAALGL